MKTKPQKKNPALLESVHSLRKLCSHQDTPANIPSQFAENKERKVVKDV